MAVVRQVTSPKSALNVAGLAALTSGSYATSDVKNNSNQPSDLVVELTITPSTVAGSKQAVLFALGSLDNSIFQTGANATDEMVMTQIGSLALLSNSTPQTKLFAVAAAFGGVLPPYIKFVVKNDSGATFTAGALSVAEIFVSVT